MECGGCDTRFFKKHRAIVVEGDCEHDLHVPASGFSYICGNLSSRIELEEYSELIVAGDVSTRAVIVSRGSTHIFVGGDFSGALRSHSSTNVWVDGDFDGLIETGHPSTQLVICGDFNGTAMPSQKASLFWMMVEGFSSYENLLKIADRGYVQFDCSTRYSDIPAGIYPAIDEFIERSKRKKRVQICVLETRCEMNQRFSR